MYKYEHGVQVTASGVVVASILSVQKIDALPITLIPIPIIDDPSGQDVTIIKRSTAPRKTALYISHNFRLPCFYIIFFVLVLPEVLSLCMTVSLRRLNGNHSKHLVSIYSSRLVTRLVPS